MRGRWKPTGQSHVTDEDSGVFFPRWTGVMEAAHCKKLHSPRGCRSSILNREDLLTLATGHEGALSWSEVF